MIDKDKCLTCGTRAEPEDAKYIPDTWLWFCSSDCYFKKLHSSYMPKRFRFDNPNDIEDDPEVKAAWRSHIETVENDVDGYSIFKHKGKDAWDAWAKRTNVDPWQGPVRLPWGDDAPGRGGRRGGGGFVR